MRTLVLTGKIGPAFGGGTVNVWLPNDSPTPNLLGAFMVAAERLGYASAYIGDSKVPRSGRDSFAPVLHIQETRQRVAECMPPPEQFTPTGKARLW